GLVVNVNHDPNGFADVHHKHPAWVTRTSCYEHDDVQYGTWSMMPNLRTHDGDTANTFTWQ
ncbi:hypothetical protein OFM93_29960, partial [Escherichia coli]|nr:hypothetical protein [Escherichia coli]